MNGAVLAGFELSWIFYRFGFFRLSILSIFRLSIWVFPFIDFIDFRLSIWVFSFIDFIDFRLSISVFSFIDFIDFRLSFSIFKSIMHFQCNIPESRSTLHLTRNDTALERFRTALLSTGNGLLSTE